MVSLWQLCPSDLPGHLPTTPTWLIETRNYNIIDYNIINNNIINNKLYTQLLEDDDVDFISENLIQIINKELDLQSRLKKIKIKEHSNNKYSE